MKNILVIRLSAIGDVLLTTPVLARLKKEYPDAQISFLVKEQYAEFVEASPHADQIHIWKKDQSLWQIRQSIAAATENFDLLLDLQSNLKTRILALFIKAEKKCRYKKPYLNRLLLVYFKRNRYVEKLKVSERYLAALEGVLADLTLREKVTLKREKLPRKIANFAEAPTVLIAPGARWATKRWPAEYFVSLASKILEKHPAAHIIWLGGPGETEVFEFLGRHPYLKRHEKRMLFLAGVLSVGAMAALADQSRVMVSNDSGLMHLLSSSKTALIALFLSTVEEFGFYPLSEKAAILSASDIPCRPCSHKGLAACPKKHFRCGFNLTADAVYASVVRHLLPET